MRHNGVNLNGDGASAVAGFQYPTRGLPGIHRFEAEAGVIAACLFDADNLPECTSVLPDPSAFASDDHAAIWAVILRRHAAGEVVDFVTVGGEMARGGKLPLPFTEGPLFDLVTDHSGAMSWRGVAYACEVRDAAALRAGIEAVDGFCREAFDGAGSPAELIERTVERLRGAAAAHLPGRTFRVAELLPDVMWKIGERQGGKRTGVATGINDLDDVTDGFQAEDLVILAARPSVGKTALALNVTDHVAVELGVPVLFVSLEMGNPLLAERLVCARALVDAHKIKTGQPLSPEEWERIHRANEQLGAAPVYMLRRPGRSMLDIANEVRRSHARDKIGLIVIDYLQLIQGDNPRDTEVQALTKISATLKNLNKELSVPILALSQLNRNLEGREDKTPRLSDLRGSGTLEQDADIVLLPHRPERYDPADRPGLAELDVAKSRNGRVGMFELEFIGKHLKFTPFVPRVAPGAGVDDAAAF